METVFGIADKKRVLARGISEYTINGQFYTFLLEGVNRRVPACYRTAEGWYLPCQRHLLLLLFPGIYPRKDVAIARAVYMANYPDVYEHIMSLKDNDALNCAVQVIPTQFASVVKHKDFWFRRHQNDWIEIIAWSDIDPNVKKGHVLIKAALGGDKKRGLRYFLIREELYKVNTGGYGFVCVPGIHKEVFLKETS